MKRRSQTVLGFQNNTQQTVSTALTRLLKTGVVERVSGNRALVRLDGTVAIKPADLYVPAEAGDRCVLSRPTEQHRWMVIGNLKTHQQPRPEFSPSSFGELSPPTSFQAFSTLAGHCGWVWAAPPQKWVAFEVQYNTVADPTGATAGLMTRGSYFFVASAVNLYARARCVGPHFQTSAWSGWIECAPGSGGGGEGVTDAADLTYTPAVLANWTGSADPGDTADALDQIADRVADLEAAPGGGVADFTDLGDVPASYTGQGGKLVGVKATEDGLEFTTVSGGTDNDAIHDNVAGEIALISEKTTVHANDLLLIEDSEIVNIKRRVKVGNLPSPIRKLYDNTLGADGTWDVGTADLISGSSSFSYYDMLEIFLYKIRSTSTSLTSNSLYMYAGTGGGALDTTALNYRSQTQSTANTTTSGTGGDNPQIGTIVNNNPTNLANSYSAGHIYLYNPGESGSHKIAMGFFHVRATAAAASLIHTSWYYENTAVIDRIGFRISNHPTDQILAGSRLVILGHKF